MNEQLLQLSQQRDALEIAKLEREISQLHLEQSEIDKRRNFNDLLASWQPQLEELVEGVMPYQDGTQFVDSREAFFDVPGFAPGRLGFYEMPTRVEDDKDGSYIPFWNTINEYQTIQGTCRFLSAMSNEAISLVEGLADYAVYKGFTHTVVADENDTSEASDELLKLAQSVLDEFHERHQFRCQCEGDIFTASRYYGEQFVRIRPSESRRGRADLEIIPTFQITEPVGKYREMLEEFYNLHGASWDYGVIWPKGSKKPAWYYQDRDNTGQSYELIPADQIVHIKLNVPSYVKRGLSDFWPMFSILRLLPKNLRNVVIQAAIQATIAYIRKIDGASGGTIDNLGNTLNKTVGFLGGKQLSLEHPGQIIDSKGADILKGPVGDSGAIDLLRVYEVGLRMVGMRYRFPEYMSTGNPGSTNRSTSDSSETPFVKSTERKQVIYCSAYQQVDWIVLDIAIRAGMFANWGIRNLDQLKQRIDVDVVAPEVGTRKRKEEADANAVLVDKKVMSRQTWADREGLDWDEEKQRIEAESKEEFLKPDMPFNLGQQPGKPGEPQPGQPPKDPKSGQQARESLTDDDRLELAASLIWEGYPGGKP